MIEKWKPIIDYEGLYGISNMEGQGRTMTSCSTSQNILKAVMDNFGYSRIVLCEKNTVTNVAEYRIYTEKICHSHVEVDGTPFKI